MEGSSGNQAAGLEGGADTKAKKRENDKAYRARQKEVEKKMEDDLETLQGEYGHLRQQHESLSTQKIELIEKLKSAANENNQLKEELDELKCQSDYNQIVLNAVSEKLDPRDKARIESFANQMNQLSQNVMLDDRMQEKKALLDKLTTLQYENDMLKIDNDALCEILRKENSRCSNSDS